MMDMSGQAAPPSGNEHGGMMTPQVTPPQVFAVTLLTLLALVAGILIAGLAGDLTGHSGARPDQPGVSRSCGDRGNMRNMKM